MLSSCIKLDDPAEIVTGFWIRDNGISYSFFDDSRYQQSNLPGEQWIWERRGDRILLYGNPDREMQIKFVDPDRMRVVDMDTFYLNRL